MVVSLSVFLLHVGENLIIASTELGEHTYYVHTHIHTTGRGLPGFTRISRAAVVFALYAGSVFKITITEYIHLTKIYKSVSSWLYFSWTLSAMRIVRYLFISHESGNVAFRSGSMIQSRCRNRKRMDGVVAGAEFSRDSDGRIALFVDSCHIGRKGILGEVTQIMSRARHRFLGNFVRRLLPRTFAIDRSACDVKVHTFHRSKFPSKV